MFATSGDILNMSLAIGFILLVIFLCVLIFFAILVLRDISKMTQDAQDMVDMVHRTIKKPLNAVDFIVAKAEPYIETVLEKAFSGKKKK